MVLRTWKTSSRQHRFLALLTPHCGPRYTSYAVTWVCTLIRNQNHKPGWWIVLADAKSDRLVVPPMKVTDVPFVDPTRPRDYRLYKLKFQAPPGTGLFTWRIIVVSDTYIGEDAAKDLRVCSFIQIAPPLY